MSHNKGLLTSRMLHFKVGLSLLSVVSLLTTPVYSNKDLVKIEAIENNIKSPHKYEDLEQFFIPELIIENLTFEQATKKLRSVYNNIAKQTGEVAIPIQFKYNTEASTEKLTLTLKNTSMLMMLSCLSTKAHMNIQHKDNTITFTPVELNSTEISKKVVVPPNIDLTEFKNIFPQSKTVKIDYSNWDRNLITFKGNSNELKNLQYYTKNIRGGLTRQIKTFITTVQTNQESAPLNNLTKNSILSENGLTTILRKTSNLKDHKLTTLPSLVSRVGESANLGVIKETNPNTDQKLREKDWIGSKASTKNTLMGFGLMTQLTYETGMLQGTEPRNQYEKITLNQYIDFNNNVHYYNFPDQTGQTTHLFITYNEIDPTGRKVTHIR